MLPKILARCIECGGLVSVMVSIDDDDLYTCPHCGEEWRGRILSAMAVSDADPDAALPAKMDLVEFMRNHIDDCEVDDLPEATVRLLKKLSILRTRHVWHADWGTNPKKRWWARAERDDDEDRRYHLFEPQQVGDLAKWRESMRTAATDGRCVVGFDFPIGIPRRYAERANIDAFLPFLDGLGEGAWREFFDVANTSDEISLHRPFYPMRPGGTAQSRLLAGLGVDHIDELRRVCERARPGRRAACPLFWTLGGNQVGKAAISGWRDVLLPLRASGAPRVGIWPFDGALGKILEEHDLAVVETYPTEFYEHFGLDVFNKRDRRCRKKCAAPLRAWAAERDVVFSPGFSAALDDGFGDAADGEDRFDAAVGLCGMINVLCKDRPEGANPDPASAQVEGWIFGQSE